MQAVPESCRSLQQNKAFHPSASIEAASSKLARGQTESLHSLAESDAAFSPACSRPVIFVGVPDACRTGNRRRRESMRCNCGRWLTGPPPAKAGIDPQKCAKRIRAPLLSHAKFSCTFCAQNLVTPPPPPHPSSNLKQSVFASQPLSSNPKHSLLAPKHSAGALHAGHHRRHHAHELVPHQVFHEGAADGQHCLARWRPAVEARASKYLWEGFTASPDLVFHASSATRFRLWRCPFSFSWQLRSPTCELTKSNPPSAGSDFCVRPQVEGMPAVRKMLVSNADRPS